jgi:diguanylate cyclase (GGDEF)-like protein
MTALVPPDHGGASYLQDTLALAARNGWCEEEGYRQRQDGTTFWATTVVTALRDAAGEAVGYSVVSHDVSERRRLEERMRDDASSTTDYLTGVSARRAYFDVAQSEVARARRYGQPLTMLLVDPDRFRELVDLHGTVFANEWLRAMAWVCRQESRTTDVVGRIGGEAFGVLLPSTELSGGLVLAERIRERMARHVFGGEFTQVRTTLSVGVAEVTDSITSVDGLLGAAGTAVERARQAGMNLVVGFDD